MGCGSTFNAETFNAQPPTRNPQPETRYSVRSTCAGSTRVTRPTWAATVGRVVLVESVPLEVVAVVDEDVVRVAPAYLGGAPGPSPVSGTSVGVKASTFEPQLRIVHEQVLRSLGLASGTTAADGPLAGDRVMNPEALVEVECLGALHLILTAAAAMVGEEASLWTRGQLYGDRYRALRRRVLAEIDTTGDGVADAARRMSVVQLMRA